MNSANMSTFTLHPVDADAGANANAPPNACLVRDAQGQWVGSLKRIGGRWKFKAIGQSANGELTPGGGPFTHRHNIAFDALDAEAVTAGLLGGGHHTA